MSKKELYQSSKVFSPEKPQNHTNQHVFKLNYLSELFSQQIKQNEDIHQSIDNIINTVNFSHQTQEKKIDQILSDQKQQKNQAEFFLEKVTNHEKTAADILHSIQNLKEHHDQLNESFQSEQLLTHAILDQLSFQDHQLRQTNGQLENYVNLAQQLSEQLIHQEQTLKEMEQKLLIQDVYHSTVMNKLEKQDAMNEKIIRQLDHLKAIVYERVNIIVEKVENSFQSTSDYFQDIFSKSGFMMPLLLSRKPKEKKEKELEEKNIN